MDKDMLLEIGNAMGQREMLLYIQRACIAKGEPLTLEDINKYNQVVQVKEMCFDVEEYEGEFHRDIRLSSIQIANS